VKTEDTDGYNAVQVGYEVSHKKKPTITKPELNHLTKAGAPAMKKLVEFKVQAAPLLPWARVTALQPNDFSFLCIMPALLMISLQPLNSGPARDWTEGRILLYAFAFICFPYFISVYVHLCTIQAPMTHTSSLLPSFGERPI